MHTLVPTLAFEAEVIPVVALAIGGGVAIVAIIFGSIRRMAQTAERERSKREIAAYVAEGSITPEDAERLIRAGASPKKD